MAWFFGDGFDLYAATTDPYMGGTYWDSGNSGSFSLAAGRFTGSRALQNASTGIWLTKSSGINESVHHFCVAFEQTLAISGSTLGLYIQLIDGTTNQCAVVFRSDGAILLTSGGPAGTVLASYTGGVTANNTWYGFEIEVVIHNTAGSFNVRKNGNTSNDFALGSLNTRGGTANNYANKISIGQNTNVFSQLIDDFLWRSDPSSVAWVGDIRCYTRMPASDAGVQWTPSGSTISYVPVAVFSTISPQSTNSQYLPVTALYDGTLASVSINFTVASTATWKCSLFASSGSAPTTVIASANPVVSPGVGTAVFTFPSPPTLTAGTQYYVGFQGNATSGTVTSAVGSFSSGTTYAAFPVANPTPFTGTSSSTWISAFTIAPLYNAAFVAQPQQDAAASYVSSSTVGQTDLYGIASIGVTPAGVVGVTTRALAQKSDAGTRNIGVQLKSGSTTSNGTSTALNTTWGWVWRNDLVDPATGAAWTPTAVNNLQIGETLTA